MKRYYNFLIIQQPSGKVVQDVVLLLTEEECNQKSFQIAEELRKQGLAFNGKNYKRYYDFLTKDITEEYLEMKKFFKEKGYTPSP